MYCYMYFSTHFEPNSNVALLDQAVQHPVLTMASQKPRRSLSATATGVQKPLTVEGELTIEVCSH